MISKVFYVIAATALASDHAYGGWAYTQWGMTPEQVVAASDGDADLLPPARQKDEGVSVLGHYLGAGISFRAAFSFKIGGLSEVQLMPSGLSNDCRDTEAALIASYGQSISRTVSISSSTTDWIDRKNDNFIQFFRNSSTCDIKYTQIREGL